MTYSGNYLALLLCLVHYNLDFFLAPIYFSVVSSAGLIEKPPSPTKFCQLVAISLYIA